MSCRVLKRDVELLMLSISLSQLRTMPVQERRGGYFFRTPKNKMVSRPCESLGFTFASWHRGPFRVDAQP